MADAHSQPAGYSVCCDHEYTIENYAEYRAEANGVWYPSPYCQGCIMNMLSMKWAAYLNGFEHAASDCAAALRRFLQETPPIGMRDPIAFVHCKGTAIAALTC